MSIISTSSGSTGIDAVAVNDVQSHSAASTIRLIVVYDVLYIVGFISLALVVLTAYISRASHRSSLWYLGVSSWAVISLANILLLGQQVGPEPNPNFCLFQAMLIYASPAYSASVNAAYMLQAYCSLTSQPHLKRAGRSRVFNIILHAVPLSILIGIILEVAVLGSTHKDKIARDASGMYCHITMDLPSKITAAITILGMSSILVLETLIFYLIRKTTKDTTSMRSSVMIRRDSFSREIFVRMAFFSSWAIVCIALSFLVYLPQGKETNTEAQIAQATLPCVATLTFGTQKDVMDSWKCWGRKTPPSQLRFRQLQEVESTNA